MVRNAAFQDGRAIYMELWAAFSDGHNNNKRHLVAPATIAATGGGRAPHSIPLPPRASLPPSIPFYPPSPPRILAIHPPRPPTHPPSESEAQDQRVGTEPVALKTPAVRKAGRKGGCHGGKTGYCYYYYSRGGGAAGGHNSRGTAFAIARAVLVQGM